MRRLRALPTIVAVLAIVVGLAELVDGALSTGISVDERVHAERTDGWLAYGWYVPERLLVGGNPDPVDELSSPFVYGPAYSSLAHLLNVELGNEQIGSTSLSQAAYSVRHLVVAALAALAAALAGIAVCFLTRSRRFGLWTAAALLSIPLWTGHGFFNPKDVPAATGYTLVTVGLLLAVAAERPPRRRLAAIVALLAGGIFIGAGTRLALWAPIFASFLGYAALRAGQRWRGAGGEGWRRDGAVLAGGAIGGGAIALLYPRAAETPRTLLTQSISASADYPLHTTTLTAGQLLPAHPPWWYLPTWIGAQTPLLIAALATLGTVLAVAVIAGAKGRGPESVWGKRQLGLLLVLQQAALVPLFAIASGATMYSGARQHLYVLPALAILAGAGAERLWRWQRERGGLPRVAAVSIGLSLALLVPTIEQSILFPYNYAYVNAIAGAGGVNGRWETDYWYTSNRESLTRVPRGSRLLCSEWLTNPFQRRYPTVLLDCPEQPFDGERGDDATRGAGGQGVWVLSWPRSGNLPPPWCEDADDVTRWLRGEEVVMGYVLHCDARQIDRTLRAQGAG